MLERGQKLDELVDKTDKLSGTSKAFYKEVCFMYNMYLHFAVSIVL